MTDELSRGAELTIEGLLNQVRKVEAERDALLKARDDVPPAVARREATFEERATWGTCETCGVGPGEWCHSELGFHLGTTIAGPLRTGEGVHLGRLQRAPRFVKLVGC